MRKSFITTMPDKPGSFLLASKILSETNLNVTRVSFNKAIDCTMLFIDVCGEEKDIEQATKKLEAIGYLSNKDQNSNVMLLEFKLIDKPGMLVAILEIINKYTFNISYIDSIENGSGYQNFRMGLYVDDSNKLREFIEETSKICEIRAVNYSKTEQNLDNTVFYVSFANEIAKKFELSQAQTGELITNSNLIMQILGEKNESPYKTFEYIGKFADSLYSFKGANFRPIISNRIFEDGTTMYLIEPPCGSNTYVLSNGNNLLFIDGGFNRYKEEMLTILRNIFEDFDEMHKEIILTHTDIDHCGLLDCFDKINISESMYENFKAETNNEPNFRAKNIQHAPYCKIGSILSDYKTPSLDKLCIISKGKANPNRAITSIGHCTICGFEFDLYEGNGGHIDGELMLLNEKYKLAFSGDIYVNIQGFSKEQAAFNKLAPYLMSRVDMDPAKATLTRIEFFKLLNNRDWLVCGGHGKYIPVENVFNR